MPQPGRDQEPISLILGLAGAFWEPFQGFPIGETRVAKIKITVTPTGINVQGEGYQGPACEKAVKFFADRLDGAVVTDEHTQDFYETPEQGQEIEQ